MKADDEGEWQSITDGASFQARQGRLDLNVARYAERWDWLDRLSSGYIVRVLNRLGGFKSSGERHSVQSLLAQCGIQNSYEKLMGRWLHKLVAEKVLEQNGLAFTSFVPLPADRKSV